MLILNLKRAEVSRTPPPFAIDAAEQPVVRRDRPLFRTSS